MLGLLFLLVVWVISRQLPAAKAWAMIKRLRIFFVSILIMYLWFTPGQLIWPVLASWSPTFEGLMQGAQRISALVILVLGVESLLRLVDRSSLLVGLYYFASCFRWIGFDRERLIIRVLLTLEFAESTLFVDNDDVEKNQVKTKGQFKFNNIAPYLDSISERLAKSFSVAAHKNIDVSEIEIDVDGLPGWLQWLIPISMVVLFTNASVI